MYKNVKHIGYMINFCICKHKFVKINKNSECSCIVSAIKEREKLIKIQDKGSIYCGLKDKFIKKKEFCNCLDKCSANQSELHLYNFK